MPALWLQLQGMDKELRIAPSSFRNSMSAKQRQYRRDLGKLQRDMKSCEPSLGFSGRPGESGHGSYGIYASQNEQSVSASAGFLSAVFPQTAAEAAPQCPFYFSSDWGTCDQNMLI